MDTNFLLIELIFYITDVFQVSNDYGFIIKYHVL
jgi:hypothetical protein